MPGMCQAGCTSAHTPNYLATLLSSQELLMVDKDQGRTVGQMKVRSMPAVRAGELAAVPRLGARDTARACSVQRDAAQQHTTHPCHLEQHACRHAMLPTVLSTSTILSALQRRRCTTCCACLRLGAATWPCSCSCAPRPRSGSAGRREPPPLVAAVVGDGAGSCALPCGVSSFVPALRRP